MSEPTAPTTWRTSLSATLPPNWFAKESMTLLAQDGQANVIASSEPIDPTIDTNQYAQIQGDLVRREFPGYEEYDFRQVTMFDGRTGYERFFAWAPPDGVKVIQVQRYYAEAGRGYTATATTPATQSERFRATFDRILTSLGRSALADGVADPAGGPAAPVTRHELLVRGFQQNGYNFQQLADNALLASFTMDAARTGRGGLMVIVQWLGDGLDVLSATAQLGDGHPSLERWWDVVAAANDWNSDRSWPIAVVTRREEAASEAEITLRTRTWLPEAPSVSHVAGVVNDIAASGVEFWEWARGQRGL